MTYVGMDTNKDGARGLEMGFGIYCDGAGFNARCITWSERISLVVDFVAMVIVELRRGGS